MKTISTGLLVYRKGAQSVEVLLGHPGGPFWARKDSWSIPKGEVGSDETEQTAAQREFQEETGLDVPEEPRLYLGEAPQGSSKINHIWAVEADPDLAKFQCSSQVNIEWPPKSGNNLEFPEIDRVAWHSLSQAGKKLFKAQTVFIERLAEELDITIHPPDEDEPQLSLL